MPNTPRLPAEEVIAMLSASPKRARGRHRPGQMNRLEARYASHLEAMKLCRIIERFDFEKVTLKLGPDLRYTPDFLVIAADLSVEFHEVKQTRRYKVTGAERFHSEDDGLAKIKAAAEQFQQFTFRVCWLTSEGWQTKEIA
jgi:hypothetical protein